MESAEDLEAARIKGAKDFAEYLKKGFIEASKEMNVLSIKITTVIEIIDQCQNGID